jgi:multidrug resistance efflux pump
VSDEEYRALRSWADGAKVDIEALQADCAAKDAEIERLRKIETAARNLQDTTIPFPVALERLDAALAPPVQEKP